MPPTATMISNQPASMTTIKRQPDYNGNITNSLYQSTTATYSPNWYPYLTVDQQQQGPDTYQVRLCGRLDLRVHTYMTIRLFFSVLFYLSYIFFRRRNWCHLMLLLLYGVLFRRLNMVIVFLIISLLPETILSAN